MAAALLRLTALILTPALAAGCVAPGDFPSLAVRPAEIEPLGDEPVRTPPPVAAEPALRAEAAGLLAAARAGESAFEAAWPAASAAARRAGAEGSESWVEAQQAISRLEAARAETMRALGALDQLLLARAEVPTNAQDFEMLSAAAAEAERLALGQQRRIDQLRGLVRS